MKYSIIALMLVAASAAFAQSKDIGSADYSLHSVGRANRVLEGDVIATRAIKVGPGQTSGVGASIGGVIGAAAGSQAAAGKTRIATAGVLGVLGGVLGNAVEKSRQRQEGVEVVIRTTSGELISVTQGDDEKFIVGDHVLVICGERYKVTRIARPEPRSGAQ